MEIRYATEADYEVLTQLDRHITAERLAQAIREKRVFVAVEAEIIGWLRFSYFWETIPFMDMLFVISDYQKQGWGKALVQTFETAMKQQGHETVMTSTAADEYAQHLYHHLGYQTVGGFFPPDEPYETILSKKV